MTGAFRLAVVLRLREMAEDAARARLATALDEHRKALEIVARLKAREEESRSALTALEATGAFAGDIVASIRRVEFAEHETRLGRDAAELKATDLFEARSTLAEATKRREVVERLRDRMRHAEILEAQRVEDATLSELAGVRHARGVVSGGEK